MSEDWTAIAAEVKAGLASVGDVSHGAAGFQVALHKPGSPGANPWDPPTDGADYLLTAVEYPVDIKNRDGTLIQNDDVFLMLEATSVVPALEDTITVGDDLFHVVNVKPLKPAGIAVLYDVQLRK